jgi:ribonuclease HI
MLVRYNFAKPFGTLIRDRKYWSENRQILHNGDLVWYTDGSKTEEGTGLGVFGPGTREYQSLGTYPTVFQAEVLALDKCISINLSRSYRNKSIRIFSDSQAAIKALTSVEIKSRVVWDCLQKLLELAMRNRVTMIWLPGHEGFEGNEIADELARRGSANLLFGPEPFCGVPEASVKAILRTRTNNKSLQYWCNTTGCTVAKKFLPNVSIKRTQGLLACERRELRVLTGLFSGHCLLRGHLCKMGVIQDPTCRFCMEADETSEHVLCECPALLGLRSKYFGERSPAASVINNTHPTKIIEYIKELELFEEL